MQTLAKRIVVDVDGETVEHQLNSPFLYLRSPVQNLSTHGNGDGDSENVGEGSYPLDTTGQNSQKLEEFVAGLRFEQKGKLDLVSISKVALDTQLN